MYIYIVALSSYLTWKISWPWNPGWGHSRSLEMLPFESLVRFPVGFHSNCWPILYHFRYKAWYIGWKSQFFYTQPAFDTSVTRGGAPRRNITIRFGTEKKTRMVWLPDRGKVWEICLIVSTQYANVIVGQTDGQTPHDGRHSVAQQKTAYQCIRSSVRI